MKRFLLLWFPVILGLTFFCIVVWGERDETTKDLFVVKVEKVLGISDVSILNFGDMMFDRGVRSNMERGMDPFKYVNSEEGSVLNDFDLVVANLEGPIVEMDRALCQSKAYNFQFPYDTVRRIKESGIDLVNLANNHSSDCYKAGAVSTIGALEKGGVGFFGQADLQKSYTIKTVDKKTIAFVGIDETVHVVPVDSFFPLIKKLKAEHDYVVVNIHWGEEYNKGTTAEQRRIGHALIDNGADVIFGHHPHVVEPVEIYKNKVIFYSLGNFIFDQVTKETKQGIGASVSFNKNKNTFTIFPFDIIDRQPKFTEGEKKTTFCKDFLKGIPGAEECSLYLHF